MVIRNTRRSRLAAHRPQIKETPKVEEKKIEEVKQVIEPVIEEVEVQVKEEPVVEQKEKRPAPRKKKKVAKKPEEEKVVFNTIEEGHDDLVEPDDVDALLKELLEEE